MISKNISKNIRKEFHNYVECIFDIEHINDSIFSDKKDYPSTAYHLLVKGYVERIKEIFYLLNLNYSADDTIITINYQNCDCVNILLRSALESVICMKLLLDNDSTLYKKYYNQMYQDRKYLVKRFNGTSRHFSEYDLDRVDNYNRYGWITSIIDEQVITLSDLVKATTYDDYKKSYYINEILHNNHLSHPNLKNDSVILDGLFRSGNVNEIIYFFEIISNLSYDLINNLVGFDQLHNEGENLYRLSQVKLIPKHKDYRILLQKDEYEMMNISSETENLLKIRKNTIPIYQTPTIFNFGYLYLYRL